MPATPSRPDPTATTAGRARDLDRLARALTDVLAPAVLVIIVVVATAWHSPPSTAAAWTATLIGVLTGAVVPMAFIRHGVRRGRWTDHHVRERAHRPWPLAVALTSGTIGTAVLWLTGGRLIVAAGLAGMSALAVATVVTLSLRWKISIHAVAAAATAAVLTVLFGPWLALAWPVAGAVAWSRVRLGDHTPAQVLVGLAIGATVTGTVFVLLARLLLS